MLLSFKRYLLLAVFPVLFTSCQQESITTESDYFELVDQYYSGDLAYETTAYLEQFWRIAGNSGFNNSIDFITQKLETAGYVNEENASQSDRFTYRIEEYPMQNPTWEPIDATILFEGEITPLLSFSSNRNMICINSVSTDKTAEVLYIEAMEDLDEIDVKGKIVYAEIHPYRLFQKAIVEKGAIGLLSYSNPSYLQPQKNKTSIQFRSIPYIKDNNAWGIALSYEANQKLKKKLSEGVTKLKVNIETKIYESTELTVVASIKGNKLQNEGMVFSAHVQEPGANDNASGVGVQLEMAIRAKELIDSEKIDNERTLTFLFGDEIVSTRRYVADSTHNNPQIKWGISLDMVGENTAISGGSFLIEKMPDPSAIWTRGEDKHTEWGGSVMGKEQMKPHYLNDLVLDIMKKQAIKTNWEVNTNPFEGGSDHVPFLRADIPSVLFWHFTDQFYHTDNDRLDKVSKETLKNVGIGSLVSAFTLVNSDEEKASEMIELLMRNAKDRLNAEFKLSEDALKNNSNYATEYDILTTWSDWYIRALNTPQDMLQNESEAFNSQVFNATKEVENLTDSLVSKLRNLSN